MTERERDKWQSQAMGAVGGAHGALIGVWLGAPLWAMAFIYLVYAIGVTVWANRKYRASLTPQAEEDRILREMNADLDRYR